MVVLIEIPFFLSLFVSSYKDCLNLKRNDFNLGKEVDLQNHIKAISSNFSSLGIIVFFLLFFLNLFNSNLRTKTIANIELSITIY